MGNRQFPHEYEYSLKCESSYTPPSEAEAWAAAGRKPCEENSERYLENMGFSIQSQKIQSILSKHGYQEVWFSTPLDQVWLQEDSFCSLSRNFDPDGMFDTVIGKICACDQAQIQPLIDDFSQINYQCIEKKWRSDIPAFLQKDLLDGLIFP